MYRVGFHDLVFADYQPFPCRLASGHISSRWMPIGMPRVNPVLENSAVFLFGNRSEPEGTGFIVGRPWRSIPTRSHYYAITNWHVAVKLAATTIRINTTDGKSRPIHTDLNLWQFDGFGDDLAGYDITDDLYEDGTGLDVLTYIHEDVFVTPDLIARFNIGIGDDVFMIGLFVGHPGRNQNAPLARFGNISRLASDQSPVEQPDNRMRPSHLVDTRSRGGFSGSPVFVYRNPFTDLQHVMGNRRMNPINPDDLFMYLLGVHCAQFPEETRVKRAEARNDAIKEGDFLLLPSSLTVVVPAWRITELLDRPYFDTVRKGREKKYPSDVKNVPVPEI
jgi:hypothetical protein